ncbi:MAG: NAD(P)/FAD-dependent oxidoreductase, partial [Myxococcales bacterium]|nr:NAD(P)/FAD-dependent oxidoreductase [Myxococcales bacterium]
MERVEIIVIGAGPAGMFAAATAAKRGASVRLLEKTARCGMKILITGKGRCNVTNIEPDLKTFATNYGKNGRAFLTALYAFDNRQVIEFFETRGLKLQTERGGR